MEIEFVIREEACCGGTLKLDQNTNAHFVPKEDLLCRGDALLELIPPFKLLSERRRLLVLGLVPNGLSCSVVTLLCAFFKSCIEFSKFMLRKILYSSNIANRGTCGGRKISMRVKFTNTICLDALW